MNDLILSSLTDRELCRTISADLSANDLTHMLCDRLSAVLDAAETDELEAAGLQDEISEQGDRIIELESQLDEKTQLIEGLEDELEDLKRATA